MIVVVAAVMISEGRILLAQREAGDARALQWELPGGTVEDGETPADGLRRECREELDVEVSPLRPFRFNHHRYHDVEILLLTYLCRIVRGTPVPKGCRDVQWFDRESICALRCSPADTPILEEIFSSGMIEQGARWETD